MFMFDAKSYAYVSVWTARRRLAALLVAGADPRDAGCTVLRAVKYGTKTARPCDSCWCLVACVQVACELMRCALQQLYLGTKEAVSELLVSGAD